MKIEAMIDRFTEKNQAVVLAEDIGREFLIEEEDLPEGAARGDHLVLELDEYEVVSIEIDEERTVERKSTVQSKLEKLRARQSGSLFRRK